VRSPIREAAVDITRLQRHSLHAAQEIGNTLPISAIDCVKEMFCVKVDLMLGSPKPEQV